MSDNYDSILKEKKVYEDYTPTHPVFKKFMLLAIFLSLVIIVVSYVVYYNTFLNGETVFVNNVVRLIDNYSIILNGADNYEVNNNYIFNGDILLDNNKYKYKYSFIKDGGKLKRTFYNDNNSVSFYYDGDSNYIKLSNYDKYISLDNELFSFDLYRDEYDRFNNNIFNYLKYILFDDSIISIYNRLYSIDNRDIVISDIRNNFISFVGDSEYSKKFYFYNGRPSVKFDIELNSKDINNILSNGNNNLVVKDEYNVIISCVNDAVTNDIKNINIIINNKTKDKRYVIYYDGKDIIFTDSDGVKYKYSLTGNSKRFNLKIYKDDILYSALEGEVDNDKYIYNYQFIDKLERYTLEVTNNNNKYEYKFISNVDNKTNNIVISGEYSKDSAISSDELDVVTYRDTLDKYRNIISNSLIKFLK